MEEVTPEGRIVWKWLFQEHVEELGKLVELIVPPSRFRDRPHPNTLEILPESPTVKQDDRFRPGNLLLCGRHIDTVFVVDRNSGAVAAGVTVIARSGPDEPIRSQTARRRGRRFRHAGSPQRCMLRRLPLRHFAGLER